MKFCWYAGALAILVSVFVIGCGSNPTPPPTNSGGIGQGPPMPEGRTSPLMSGSAEEAEKTGHGPGRGQFPEGYRDQGVPTKSDVPTGLPGVPPR